jgi:hypothetical protein
MEHKPDGEKIGFDHVPRIAYALFWRTLSRTKSKRAAGATKLVVFGALGTTW